MIWGLGITSGFLGTYHGTWSIAVVNDLLLNKQKNE